MRRIAIAIAVTVVALSLARANARTRVEAQLPGVLAPQSSPAGAQTGTAAITGTIVDALTGVTIPSAIVTLEDRRPDRPRAYPTKIQVATPRGRFAFVDLGASEMYILTVRKQGYLDGGYGRPDPRGASAPIVLKDGQWMQDVRMTLAHPGSISGTVVDERGEPVVDAHVRVLLQIMIAGRTEWLSGAAARTDDRGAYRIAGLSPAKYVVSVPSVQATLPVSATIKSPGAMTGTSRADMRMASDAASADKLLVNVGGGLQAVVGRYATPPPMAPDGRRMAYPIAFYPNVSRLADATTIDLAASQDRLGIDLQVQPVRTSRLSGIVQGPPDAVGNLLLRLIPVGLEELGQGSEAATTVTLADGRFTFLDVPAGSYVLDTRHMVLDYFHTSMSEAMTAVPAPIAFPTFHARAGGNFKAGPPAIQLSSLRDAAPVNYSGRLRLDLQGRDIDDVVLPLRRPATLSGRIVWAPAADAPVSPPSVILEPADGRRSLGLPEPSRDGFGPASLAFRIDGLMQGRYFLRFESGGGMVESIMWDGQDYTYRPFDATSGQDFSDVVVTMSSATSSVIGMVADANAIATSGAAVIAFPVEQERWSNYGLNPPWLRSALAGSDGRFRIDGLPRGDYYLLAVPASQDRGWIDPSFLGNHVGRATRIQVDRSDAKISNVSLRIVR